MHRISRAAIVAIWATGGIVFAQSPVLQATFDTGPDGFTYADDRFRGTSQPAYASGTWAANAGASGGGLQVDLGGVDGNSVIGMSGGFERSFTLPAPADLQLRFRFRLRQSADYENDERSEVLAELDGSLVGQRPFDYVSKIVGNGNGGSTIGTEWQEFRAHLGTVAAGNHVLALGGFNSKKSLQNEFTTIRLDDVVIEPARAPDPSAAAAFLVGQLDFQSYKNTVRTIASFGDRTQGSQSYANAALWLEQQLQAEGYTVERHPYTYFGQPRESLYVTFAGDLHPDRMWIVSAHFDGRGGGGACDDDGSGCALALEVARALARSGVATGFSIRFVFWNNEETGLNGSTAYVQDRHPLQGTSNPAGSRTYPEPTWLGIFQHDMILFDHGLPPQATQIPTADIDVEYRAGTTCVAASTALALAHQGGNTRYAATYPVQVTGNMCCTDSWPFRNFTAAISVRENQRLAEIGRGSNPHWHQPTDVFPTYSDADFRLGFETMRTTFGTVAELAGAFFPAEYSSFGSGCPGSAGTPTLMPAAGSLPWTGEDFVLRVGNLPGGSTPVGVVGLSDQAWGAIPLPRDLGPAGLPGCTQYVSADFTFLLPASMGSATWTLGLPPVPALAGMRFFVQALVPDPGVNATGAVVTGAGAAVIGVR